MIAESLLIDGMMYNQLTTVAKVKSQLYSDDSGAAKGWSLPSFTESKKTQKRTKKRMNVRMGWGGEAKCGTSIHVLDL